MILDRLSLQLPLAQLSGIAKDAEVHKPQKKDYWPEQWKTMKHHAGAHIHEIIAGKELFYQLDFMHDHLVSVQINTTGVFTDITYAALISISDQVIAANVERGLNPEGEAISPRPWDSIKDERLAESGLPNDRYLIFRSMHWRTGDVHSYLNVSLEWPQVLALEYREATNS